VEEETILQFLETPYQFEPPIPRIIRTDIQTAINHLNPKKSQGYDLIAGNILKGLPIIGTKYLTQLFNAILLLNYSPAQWKVAQIIIILKAGKPPHALSFYRPISLLPIVSKIFEKLLLKCTNHHHPEARETSPRSTLLPTNQSLANCIKNL
jgi:hypothetical protein